MVETERLGGSTRREAKECQLICRLFAIKEHIEAFRYALTGYRSNSHQNEKVL